MKLGILADIHGRVEYLRIAIERLNNEQVDQFIVLGDVIYDRKNATETVAMLNDCGAIGVWGNHELGLCIDPDDSLRQLYDPSVFEFFGQLHSHLEIENVLVSHTLPHQDPTDPISYYLGQRPNEKGALSATFAEFPHRMIMIGHFHRWFAATPDGQIEWDGAEPVQLDSNQRYLFIIHAVMDGWAALYDLDPDVITPIRLQPLS